MSRISQPVRPAQRSAVSMAFLASNTFSFLVLTLFSFASREVVPLNYASIASDDDGFKLRWAYNNNRLMFNLTCKTTGWCAVGFTTTADGKRMVNYDIALGGVASNTGYLDGYQSTSFTVPPRDPTPDYNLIKATEENGFTNVQFDRIPTTEGDEKDVQFGDNTEVWIVWAWRRNDDANLGLNGSLKHTATGISTRKYNLFKEAQGSNTANVMGLPASTLAILTPVACALPLF